MSPRMSNNKKPVPPKQKPTPPAACGDFNTLVSAIVHIHSHSQAFATKAVNTSLTVRNWMIGQRIVEFEQLGQDRATYGEKLLPALAEHLSAAGLKRVDTRELRRFRLFYSVYPQIRETVTPELLADFGAAASPNTRLHQRLTRDGMVMTSKTQQRWAYEPQNS